MTLLPKIWERYFYKEIFKCFFFFLFVFYGLYVIIDYSSHASSIHYSHSQFKILVIAQYYLFDFIEKSEVLIPFGLLLATIRTLTNFNTHNELIALMASGVSIRTLLKPFIVVGLAMVVFMYINTQFWMPYALQQMNHIDQKHRSQKNKANQIVSVQNLVLKDKTSIIFQNYDAADRSLLDAYWIRSIDDIYRIQSLHPYQEIPTGKQVEHLQRGSDGQLTVTKSYDTLQFPEMRFHKRDLFHSIMAPEDESLTDLWKKMPESHKVSNEKESQMISVFYNKMIMPWLCLLAVIGPAPFCIRFSRNIPLFFIYALSIFALLALYLITDATLVLGRRQILDPWMAILLPFGICASAASYRFVRL